MLILMMVVYIHIDWPCDGFSFLLICILKVSFFYWVGPRYHDEDMPSPYGCHPCEPPRIPDHGWRYPPRSMNHRNTMPFRPPFEDAIPVTNRGSSSLTIIFPLS